MGVVHSTPPSDGNGLGPPGRGTSGPKAGGGGMSAAYRPTSGPGRPATVALVNGWGRGSRVRVALRACVLGLSRERGVARWRSAAAGLRGEAGEARQVACCVTPRLKTQLLHGSGCLMEEVTWRLQRVNGDGNHCRTPKSAPREMGVRGQLIAGRLRAHQELGGSD